jgi:hypothetical protein
VTDIDHQKVIGIAHEIANYLPAKPPIGSSADERQAYYAGWRECAQMFEDSLNRMVRDAAGNPDPWEKYPRDDQGRVHHPLYGWGIIRNGIHCHADGRPSYLP